MDQPIQGEVEILLVTSCYGTGDKRLPDGSLGSYGRLYLTDLTLCFILLPSCFTLSWSQKFSFFFLLLKRKSCHDGQSEFSRWSSCLEFSRFRGSRFAVRGSRFAAHS